MSQEISETRRGRRNSWLSKRNLPCEKQGTVRVVIVFWLD